MMKISMLIVFTILEWMHMVWGHGYLQDPPSRSSMWRFGFNTPRNYNDNQLFCGGFDRQWNRNKGKCGICGDPWDDVRVNEAGGRYATGIISKRYKIGQFIQVKVRITASHFGYFEFRLCPNNDPSKAATQQCLDQYVLHQPDGSIRFRERGRPQVYTISLKLPAGLSCTQCILQWKYNAGNSYGFNERGNMCKGCGKQEQFYGCADIAIDSNGSNLPHSISAGSNAQNSINLGLSGIGSFLPIGVGSSSSHNTGPGNSGLFQGVNTGTGSSSSLHPVDVGTSVIGSHQIHVSSSSSGSLHQLGGTGSLHHLSGAGSLHQLGGDGSLHQMGGAGALHQLGGTGSMQLIGGAGSGSIQTINTGSIGTGSFLPHSIGTGSSGSFQHISSSGSGSSSFHPFGVGTINSGPFHSNVIGSGGSGSNSQVSAGSGGLNAFRPINVDVAGVGSFLPINVGASSSASVQPHQSSVMGNGNPLGNSFQSSNGYQSCAATPQYRKISPWADNFCRTNCKTGYCPMGYCNQSCRQFHQG